MKDGVPYKRCNRNDRHDEHEYEYGSERAGGQPIRRTCPGYVGDSGMRLSEEKTPAQRRIEAHEEALANVRTLTNESVRLMLVPGWTSDKSVELNVRFRVALVEANAQAALAYAISEAGSDLEVALSRIGSALESGVIVSHE